MLGHDSLALVKANNLFKGLRKGLSPDAIISNNLSTHAKGKELQWLSEFQDLFLEEFTKLPPYKEVAHEIDLKPRT